MRCLKLTVYPSSLFHRLAATGWIAPSAAAPCNKMEGSVLSPCRCVTSCHPLSLSYLPTHTLRVNLGKCADFYGLVNAFSAPT